MDLENAVSAMDVLNLLIDMKDSQIMQLNNLITWGIAITTISVTLISVGFGWAFKKINDARIELDNQLDISKRLIKSLEDSNSKIIKAQSDIDLILRSDDFEDKLYRFEKSMEKMEISTKKWEKFHEKYKEKMFTIERYKLLTSFSTYVRLLSNDIFLVRYNNEDASRISDIMSIEASKEELTNKELIDLIEELETLFNKYHEEEDDYAYMV